MGEHALEPYREVLRQSSEDTRGSFSAARSHLRSYYNQGRSYNVGGFDDNGVAPMNVDAVSFHKGNGKDGKDGKKGKDKGKGKLKSKGEKFDGECGYCGKWGHKRADCRKKAAAEAAEKPPEGGAAAAKSGPGQVRQIQFYDDDVDETYDDSDGEHD